MQNAKLLKRLLSCIYEALVCIAIAMLVTLVMLALIGDATSGVKRLLLQLILWCSIGWYFVHSWVKTGQTVAMRAWKLKVIPKQAGLTYAQAIARYCLATVLMPTGISIVWALIDKDGLFLHDRLLNLRIVQLQNN